MFLLYTEEHTWPCVLPLAIAGLRVSSRAETEMRKNFGNRDEITRLEHQNDAALAKFLAGEWVCACARERSNTDVFTRDASARYVRATEISAVPAQAASN